MKQRIFTIYNRNNNITFIMRESFTERDVGTLEVKGFYFGRPNKINNKIYYNTLESTIYSDEETQKIATKGD